MFLTLLHCINRKLREECNGTTEIVWPQSHNDFEKWEPDARRRARPVLRERGGEIPPRHSPRDQFIPFASNMQKQSPTASIIDEGHKLLLWFDPDREDELYHVLDDPEEKDNLLHQKPELASALKRRLMNWLASARHSYEEGDYPGYTRQGRFIKTEE